MIIDLDADFWLSFLGGCFISWFLSVLPVLLICSGGMSMWNVNWSHQPRAHSLIYNHEIESELWIVSWNSKIHPSKHSSSNKAISLILSKWFNKLRNKDSNTWANLGQSHWNNHRSGSYELVEEIMGCLRHVDFTLTRWKKNTEIDTFDSCKT